MRYQTKSVALPFEFESERQSIILETGVSAEGWMLSLMHPWTLGLVFFFPPRTCMLKDVANPRLLFQILEIWKRLSYYYYLIILKKENEFFFASILVHGCSGHWEMWRVPPADR